MADDSIKMRGVIDFDPIRLPSEAEKLRTEVRDFLQEEISAGRFNPKILAMQDGYDLEFSRRVGARGWIGMTWPKKYA